MQFDIWSFKSAQFCLLMQVNASRSAAVQHPGNGSRAPFLLMQTQNVSLSPAHPFDGVPYALYMKSGSILSALSRKHMPAAFVTHCRKHQYLTKPSQWLARHLPSYRSNNTSSAELQLYNCIDIFDGPDRARVSSKN